MTPVKTSKTTQQAVRLPHDLLREADEVAALMAQPGIEYSRADVLRAAITEGLPLVRARAEAAKKAR